MWKQIVKLALIVLLAFAASYLAAVLAGERQRRREEIAQKSRDAQVLASTKLSSLMGRLLPAANLMTVDGQPFPDPAWRKGKVMLVLLTTGCEACRAEGTFLSSAIRARSDVKFLGVLSFEQDQASLLAAQKLFPFPVVRDDRMELMQALRLTSVPVKIYLVDGVVKRSWGGATADAQAQREFMEWLRRA
jgi:hypothetical protein